MAPESRITHPKFQYTPASKTDIRLTFRRHGFVGPEERREAQRHAPAQPPRKLNKAQAELYRQMAGAADAVITSAEGALGLRALFG